MHGMTVVDRALVVELAAAARDAAAAGPVNPFAALQMQQMHQARRMPHTSRLLPGFKDTRVWIRFKGEA